MLLCEVSKALAVLMPATHDPAHCGVRQISQSNASAWIVIVLHQSHPKCPSSWIWFWVVLVFWLVAELR